MVLGFKIDISEKNSTPIIQVRGEIDAYTTKELSESLSTAIEDGDKAVILNLNDVNFIDSVGLGVIASKAEVLTEKGRALKVVCNNNSVKRIFDIAGLDTVIQLDETDDTALTE
ncbi:anti-sigma B factor antagonist [Candidatus Marinamargulisbacteria bacterium SCGC AG-439-L15]|nr:anti-sigma B factor antagonist [Candidatus Marinamargulisbacteria bacterium SCGC AG-439-L15]